MWSKGDRSIDVESCGIQEKYDVTDNMGRSELK